MRVCSISFDSSAFTNFWLSVSRGSRLRGAMSVNCVIPGPLPSMATTNRLFSRTNVMAVSLRAQRGADSAPVVRVITRRVPATASSSTMSP
jgi:hypothetical protein